MGFASWGVVVGILCSVLCMASSEYEDKRWLKNVCMSAFEPLVICEKDLKEAPVGYHVSLFEATAAALGLTDYKFKCLTFDEMMDDIKDGGKKCDIGIGAITLTSERMSQGVQFSFPTYHGSVGALVPATFKEGGTWSFLTPLDWTVWLAIGITSIVVPVIVFVIESWSVHGFVESSDVSIGVIKALYDGIVMALNFGGMTVKSIEARIVVIGYGFLVLILVNTYVANLTAFLTLTSVSTSIRKIDDLPGKRIIAGEIYSKRLEDEGISVSSTFTSGEREAVTGFLTNSNIEVILYDDAWTRYHAAKNCSLFSFVDVLLPFEYAFALPYRLKQHVENVSTALVHLQEIGLMGKLQSESLGISGKLFCPELDDVSNETESVHFRHMVGLWFLLAACVGVAFIWACAKWVIARRREAKKETKPVEKSFRKAARVNTILESKYHQHAALVHATSIKVSNLSETTSRKVSSVSSQLDFREIKKEVAMEIQEDVQKELDTLRLLLESLAAKESRRSGSDSKSIESSSADH